VDLTGLIVTAACVISAILILWEKRVLRHLDFVLSRITSEIC